MLGIVLANLRRWQRDLRLLESLRRLPEDVPVLTRSPRVSVLVSAWKAEEYLETLVRSFRSIEYENKELVVAVGAAHRLASWQELEGAGVRLLEYVEPADSLSKNQALVRCLAAATGDILVLTDADCRLNSRGFLHLIAPIANGEEKVTTGPSYPQAEVRDNLFVQQYWADRAYTFAHTGRYTGSLRGRNSALTRAALEAAGGFVPDLLGDDYYLGMKLQQVGYKIRFVPDSAIETIYHASVLGYVGQRARWRRAVAVENQRLGLRRQSLTAWKEPIIALAVLGLTMSLRCTGKRGLAVLLLPLLQGYLARLRALHFAVRMGLFPMRPAHLGVTFLRQYVDYVTQARALIEFMFPKTRYRW